MGVVQESVTMSRLFLAALMTTESPSIEGTGRVVCDTSAKPLVPYSVGVSGRGHLQQPRRSRLAKSHGVEQTPGRDPPPFTCQATLLSYNAVMIHLLCMLDRMHP